MRGRSWSGVSLLVIALCTAVGACGDGGKAGDDGKVAKVPPKKEAPAKAESAGDDAKAGADGDVKAEAGAADDGAVAEEGGAEEGKAEAGKAEAGDAAAEAGAAEAGAAEAGAAEAGAAEAGAAEAGAAEAGEAPPDPKALLKEVTKKKTKDERALEALAEAEEAGAKLRDIAKAAKKRGDALFADPERAKKFYDWAAEKDKKYADPLFALAKQAANKGEIEETKKLLKQVHERKGKKLLKQIAFDPMWEIVKDDPEVKGWYGG